MKTTVSSKGQIVLLVELWEQDRILPGQQFELERLEAGQYLLRRQPAEASESLVDWLLSCPSSDWSQPLPSESTDERIGRHEDQDHGDDAAGQTNLLFLRCEGKGLVRAALCLIGQAA